MVNIPIGGSSASASNVPTTRNAMTIQIQPAIRIPSDAKNVRVYLRSLNCPYSFVNINSSNNLFYWTDDASNPTKYSFTFANGLYSLTSINSQLQVKLQNAINTSGFAFTNNLFTYTADPSTNTTYMTINSSGYQVSHNTGTFQNLTGFTANRKTPSGATLTTGASTYFTGNNIVQFQNVTNVIVSVSLPINYYFNNQARPILANVPVTVTPQSIITYPVNSVALPEYNKIDCNLAGATLSSLTVRLLDQNLADIDLNGYDFSVEINIEYNI